MQRRVAVIANPTTRRDVEKIFARMAHRRPEHVVLETYVTDGPGAAAELARRLGPDVEILVAIGGDGTVSEVATAIAGSQTRLGIIPAGSTNIIARELAIPVGLDAAVNLVFHGEREHRMDVGQVGDRRFLHMAGAGLDSHIFANADRRLKRRVGWVAYLPPGFMALKQPIAQMTVDIDGEAMTVASRLVVVANGTSVVTPRLALLPEMSSNDGWLDVLIFTAASPVTVARTIGGLLTHRLHRSPDVIHRRGRKIVIGADPPLPVQLDGDAMLTTPVTITIDPRALRVLVP